MLVLEVLLGFLVLAKAQSSDFDVVRNLQQWNLQSHVKPILLAEMKDDPKANEIYLRMVDASAKIPTGILMGNLFHLGDFDECYNIHSNNIYGKYCLGFIPLKQSAAAQAKSFNGIAGNPELRTAETDREDGEDRGDGSATTGLYWSICVPSSLSVERLNKISSAIVSNVTNNTITKIIEFQENTCYSKDTEPSLSAGAILTTTTLAVFLAISLLSTLYDIFLYYTERQPVHEMLIAFSYLTNGQKLIKANKNPDHLLCLNGIRAISMMWVILGHLYSSVMNAPVSNNVDVLEWLKDPGNMIINGATVSVDTFFAVGGLVATYTFLNAMAKGQKFNIFMYYLHRFLRLTPAYGIAILAYYNLLPYLGNGPLWYYGYSGMVDGCRKAWWSSILYFANFMHDGFCVPQAWYLQVDMQLFLLSPLVLIPLIKWKKIAYVELATLAVAGVVVPLCLSYFEDIKAPGLNTADALYLYYAAPHARFGPYVIGIIFGLLLHKLKKSKPKPLNQWSICAMWIATLGVLLACVFGGVDFRLIDRPPAADDPWANAIFMGFNRNGWSLAVCLVIYLCIAGYGGPINYFLSIPTFQFLSKLSYSMYLVHFALISINFTSRRHNVRFSNGNMMFDFWGFFMLTLAISTVLCLTFESPVIIIEKWIFGTAAKKIVKPDASKETIDKNEHNNV